LAADHGAIALIMPLRPDPLLPRRTPQFSRHHRIRDVAAPLPHPRVLARRFVQAGLPKITNGWFFRAESFFSVARYQDKVNLEDIPGVPPGTPPDFLSHSHGEGFLRFFQERCRKQGIFIFDEPESALSPGRQIEFLKLMWRMENSQNCQIIMATHSPVLMAYPDARLLRLTKYGLEPVTVEQTDHYKVMREFCDDPAGFVEAAMAE
jgi:predicted ATPase